MLHYHSSYTKLSNEFLLIFIDQDLLCILHPALSSDDKTKVCENSDQ